MNLQALPNPYLQPPWEKKRELLDVGYRANIEIAIILQHDSSMS